MIKIKCKCKQHSRNNNTYFTLLSWGKNEYRLEMLDNDGQTYLIINKKDLKALKKQIDKYLES